eukprot:1849139-Rhodomonas_salina.1
MEKSDHLSKAMHHSPTPARFLALDALIAREKALSQRIAAHEVKAAASNTLTIDQAAVARNYIECEALRVELANIRSQLTNIYQMLYNNIRDTYNADTPPANAIDAAPNATTNATST